MKATGIVRRIDDLGRVVIPKEIRRTMRIREGDPLEIYTSTSGEVILKKYSPKFFSAAMDRPLTPAGPKSGITIFCEPNDIGHRKSIIKKTNIFFFITILMHFFVSLTHLFSFCLKCLIFLIQESLICFIILEVIK